CNPRRDQLRAAKGRGTYGAEQGFDCGNRIWCAFQIAAQEFNRDRISPDGKIGAGLIHGNRRYPGLGISRLSSVRRRTFSLRNAAPRCCSTVRGEMPSFAAISEFVAPSAAALAISYSRGVSPFRCWGKPVVSTWRSPQAFSSERVILAQLSAPMLVNMVSASWSFLLASRFW